MSNINASYTNETLDPFMNPNDPNNNYQYHEGIDVKKHHGHKKRKRRVANNTNEQSSVPVMEPDNTETEYQYSKTSGGHAQADKLDTLRDDKNLSGTRSKNKVKENITGYLSIAEIARDIRNTNIEIQPNEKFGFTSCPLGTMDNSDPVVGYAEEPLLPLHEACAPLSDILHDLSYYVEMALTETPENPPDGLTIDESAAVRLYTIEWEAPHRSLYSSLNYTLKSATREELRPYFGYLKLFLTAIVKIPCLPLLTVWRGVTRDLSEEFSPGTIVTWWGFSSCTRELTVLENNMYLGKDGARTLFSVEAINARTVSAHSHFVTEDEVLLLPGTQMEVHSKLNPAPGLHIVHLKQTKPIQTLLEPPFEGAPLYPCEKKPKPWYRKTRTRLELSAVLIVIIVGIIIGGVVGSRRPPPPPICIPRKTNVKADYFWSFNCGDLREELTGMYNATPINGASTVTPDFPGYGRALRLERVQNQHAILPRSLNLTLNTSFTVSGWVLVAGYKRKTILSDCNSFNSLCITFIVDNSAIVVEVGTWNNTRINQQISVPVNDYICQSCWMHFAVSFNRKNSSTHLYFNGNQLPEYYLNLTAASMSKETTKRSYIGMNAVTNAEPFYGLIDQLAVFYGVKTYDEILFEAGVLCEYRFDNDDVNLGWDPYSIQAVSQRVYRAKGTNGNNLAFNDTDSYFQSSGFTLLNGNGYEYSLAFWIRVVIPQPNKINSAVAVLQISTLVSQLATNSYTCIMTMFVNAEDQSLGYYFPGIFQFKIVNNSFIPNNSWVHIGLSYKSPDIYLFYQNGVLIESNQYQRYAWIVFGIPRFAVTVGGAYLNDSDTNKPDNFEQMKCFATLPLLNYTKMYGEIDNLGLYSRVLTAKEFGDLAKERP